MKPLSITKIHDKPGGRSQFWWVRFSPRVARMEGEKIEAIAYFQFPTEAEARQFWQWATDNKYRCEVRRAERFAFGWECKVRALPDEIFFGLAARDRSR